MARVLVAVFAVLFSVVGCKPHTHLEAPKATAPERERLEAYRHLVPHARAETVETSGDWVVKRTTDYIVLGDGRRVYHADDLLAVVPPDSDAARAARASASARSTGTTIAILGTAAALIGGALIFNSINSSVETDSADSGFSTGQRVGIALGLGGAAALGIGAIYFQRVENDERVSAFTTYPEGLRARLDLCVTDGKLASCDAEPTPAAVPAPVAPPAASESAPAPEPAGAASSAEPATPPAPAASAGKTEPASPAPATTEEDGTEGEESPDQADAPSPP